MHFRTKWCTRVKQNCHIIGNIVRSSSAEVFRRALFDLSPSALMSETKKEQRHLVVEALSSSTDYCDLSLKKDMSEESGVKGDCVVDPNQKTTESSERVNGEFVSVAKTRESEVVACRVFAGLRCNVEQRFEA